MDYQVLSSKNIVSKSHLKIKVQKIMIKQFSQELSDNNVQKFQEKNSWVVALYFDRDDLKIDFNEGWSYVIYHWFCYCCSRHEKIKARYFESDFYLKNYVCYSCGNKIFLCDSELKEVLKEKAIISFKTKIKYDTVSIKTYIDTPVVTSSNTIENSRKYFDSFTIESIFLNSEYYYKDIEHMIYDNNISLEENIYNFLIENLKNDNIKFNYNCKIK